MDKPIYMSEINKAMQDALGTSKVSEAIKMENQPSPDKFFDQLEQNAQSGIEEDSSGLDPKRLGLFTGSRMPDYMTCAPGVKNKTKSWADPNRFLSFGKSAITELYVIAHERMTGTKRPSFESYYTQWGLDHEEEAAGAVFDRLRFELFECGFEIGLYDEDGNPVSGSTPDYKSAQARAYFEIKCYEDGSKHLKVMNLTPDDKHEHYAQWQCEMMSAGVEKIYYCSYDPRMKEPKQKLVIKIVKKDEDYQVALKNRCLLGHKAVNSFIEDQSNPIEYYLKA
ncbi:hypothetical protein KA005_08935, partial [bacterium]|nr:hypothetical protein [bacterium]